MKNSNDTIGNRSRDLPVFSAVPQLLHHRVPPFSHISNRYLHVFSLLNYASCKEHEETTKQPAQERDSDNHYDTQQLTLELNPNQQQKPHKTDIVLYTNKIQRTPRHLEFDLWKFLHLSTVGPQLLFLIISNTLYRITIIVLVLIT
jgi:hypothetical protein